MRFTPEFLDELKNRITLSDVVGRRVKLVRAGREFSGLCPFHSEKTPSFTVNDQKEFYHCFGCGSHGGAIDFIMGTEGVEFPEAVERLAGEAGMDLPKFSREDIEKQKERSTLYDVMEAVTNWYGEQLKAQVGAEALQYVKNRGLKAETVRQFKMGYAPNRRDGLKQAMLSRKFSEAQLIETGMLIKPDDGRESYDRFRNRLMFPISDKRGHIIAFGGRALEKDAKAKYLNSPETSLFHKGHNLYNFQSARQAAYEGGTILVVEGYMDVIALAQFGIAYAVAPLGTALTEDQMKLLWKMADEPVLSFDGDKAGLRAATRSAERSLPLLTPGKSLRFVLLPAGEDPDSLVQKEGRKAMEGLIDKASPLVDTLWGHLLEGVDTSTPERRAGVETKIFSALGDIADEKVKKLYMSEYGRRLKDLFWQIQSAGRKSGGAKGKGKMARWAEPKSKLGTTAIGRGGGVAAVTARLEELLILTMLHHPELLVTHLEDFADITFTQPKLKALQEAVLDLAHERDVLDFEAVATHIDKAGLAPEMSEVLTHIEQDWFVGPDAALADSETGFAHTLARYQRIGPALEEFRQAEQEFGRDMNEQNQKRFMAAQKAFEEILGKEETIDHYGLASNRISTL